MNHTAKQRHEFSPLGKCPLIKGGPHIVTVRCDSNPATGKKPRSATVAPFEGFVMEGVRQRAPHHTDWSGLFPPPPPVNCVLLALFFSPYEFVVKQIPLAQEERVVKKEESHPTVKSFCPFFLFYFIFSDRSDRLSSWVRGSVELCGLLYKYYMGYCLSTRDHFTSFPFVFGTVALARSTTCWSGCASECLRSHASGDGDGQVLREILVFRSSENS